MWNIKQKQMDKQIKTKTKAQRETTDWRLPGKGAGEGEMGNRCQTWWARWSVQVADCVLRAETYVTLRTGVSSVREEKVMRCWKGPVEERGWLAVTAGSVLTWLRSPSHW